MLLYALFFYRNYDAMLSNEINVLAQFFFFTFFLHFVYYQQLFFLLYTYVNLEFISIYM